MCFDSIHVHGEPLSTDITELTPSTRKNSVGKYTYHTDYET